MRYASVLAREIKTMNPDASQTDIAKVLGISKQAVSQALSQAPPTQARRRKEVAGPKYVPRYEVIVGYVQRTIPERGRIWEGCRPAFEAGKYYDENLARMLREGVIVPAADPDGGYVLPPDRQRT